MASLRCGRAVFVDRFKRTAARGGGWRRSVRERAVKLPESGCCFGVDRAGQPCGGNVANLDGRVKGLWSVVLWSVVWSVVRGYVCSSRLC